MKWITIKLGEIRCAEFGVDDRVLITELRINNMPVITRMPLVLPEGATLTISVGDEKVELVEACPKGAVFNCQRPKGHSGPCNPMEDR